MAKGDEPVKKQKRSSLRILGTVGEPINPEAWRWYYEVSCALNAPSVQSGGLHVIKAISATTVRPQQARECIRRRVDL